MVSGRARGTVEGFPVCPLKYNNKKEQGSGTEAAVEADDQKKKHTRGMMMTPPVTTGPTLAETHF